MDITTFMAAASVCLAFATFFIGRVTAGRNSGRETGSLSTDIRYIKESGDKMERRLDEISIKISGVCREAVCAKESVKSAHKRLDEHLTRDHGKNISESR